MGKKKKKDGKKDNITNIRNKNMLPVW
jgi:hypothetical protein